VAKLFDSDLENDEKRELIKKKTQIAKTILAKQPQKEFIGKSKARREESEYAFPRKINNPSYDSQVQR